MSSQWIIHFFDVSLLLASSEMPFGRLIDFWVHFLRPILRIFGVARMSYFDISY